MSATTATPATPSNNNSGSTPTKPIYNNNNNTSSSETLTRQKINKPLSREVGPTIPIKIQNINDCTSNDTKYPPENAIDGNIKTFHLTTGLFPQVIGFELAKESIVKKVIVTSTGVARWNVEKGTDSNGLEYEKVATNDCPESGDALQNTTISIPPSRTKFIRLVITKAYADFCSIRKVVISE